KYFFLIYDTKINYLEKADKKAIECLRYKLSKITPSPTKFLFSSLKITPPKAASFALFLPFKNEHFSTILKKKIFFNLLKE
ncbi:hypothetical protein, partial [Bacteroides ovatus]|uniref:hypothetical protein n=1 Tax=Bacteroides ovatus TaxID=28116 RepID=UPI001E353190